MALITGTPPGTSITQEDLYIEGAPTIYIQDYLAPLWYSPDSDDFYWNLTGTSTYNVIEIGCVSDVSFTEGLTMNDVLCDNVGVKDTIQQRNYFDIVFTVQSFFPLSILRYMLGTGATTETSPTEKLPLGKINNAQRYHVWAPKVYDEDYGDYIGIHLHKCKFVDAWTINMGFGSPWTLTALKLRAFVDATMPAAQQFGAIIRSDLSVIT